MSCFSCFVSRSNKDVSSVVVDNGNGGTNVSESGKGKNVRSGNNRTAATSFSFRELALATSGFNQVNLIGEGGFGKVFKGRLSTNELVAVKQLLSPDGCQGVQEFVTEVLMLSLLHDSNLVKLFGYCAEGDQRLLVCEYMPMGSLEDHLFDVAPDKEPLSWNSRMKIALGAARGLEYLHCKAHPPVIHRDMKSANILLDNDFNPKLSDFGLAKLGPVGDDTHVSTRVMGTHGYCAPEYAMSGRLTIKSDIYSFGVVLLELISGERAIDPDRQEQNLVSWFRPYFKHRSNYGNMVDPLLQRNYPIRSLYQAIAVTVMCLQEEPKFRPLIGDVVSALEYIASNSQVDGHGVHSPLLQLDPEMHIS